jgi:hypothetical protein
MEGAPAMNEKQRQRDEKRSGVRVEVAARTKENERGI